MPNPNPPSPNHSAPQPLAYEPYPSQIPPTHSNPQRPQRILLSHSPFFARSPPSPPPPLPKPVTPPPTSSPLQPHTPPPTLPPSGQPSFSLSRSFSSLRVPRQRAYCLRLRPRRGRICRLGFRTRVEGAFWRLRGSFCGRYVC